MSSNSAFITAGFDSAGANFAAVYQALDSHRLRVVPTAKAGNKAPGREFIIDKSTKIGSLIWAVLPPSSRPQPLKKRKKGPDNGPDLSSGQSNSPNDVVVLGSNQGTLLFYSPASGSLTSTLKTGSSAPVCGIVTPNKSGPASKLFSLQVDGTFTEFDLVKMSLIASSVISIQDCSAAASLFPHFLIANTQPSLFKDGEVEMTFPGFSTPIKQLLPLGNKHFAALAEEDRQVTIYDVSSTKPVNYLTAPATNASHMSVSSDLTALAVSTEDGLVHVYENPTKPAATAATANSDSKSSRKVKSVSRIAPKLTIDVSLEKKATRLSVHQTKFADNFLQLVWPEQGSMPVFDQVKIRVDNTNQLATGAIKIERQPAAPLAREYLVGGVDPASVANYEDNQAQVVSGEHVGDLSDDESMADRLDALEVEMNKNGSKSVGGSGSSTLNGSANGTHGSSASDNGTNNDIQTSNANKDAESRLRKKDLKLKLSQPGSFATLLNQSLTLNDKQLLEICLEEKDSAMIKTSIIKLEPALAASLLEHLASTMAHSQNRSGTLTQWIRWVVVIHGGYLVTLPNLLKTLAALHSTLSTRAATLPRLLALQGRLELLEEQLTVRNEIATALEDEDDDVPEAYYDEEEAMIVNGEEAYDDDEDEDGGESASDIDDNESSGNEEDGDANLSDDGDLSEDDEIMLSD